MLASEGQELGAHVAAAASGVYGLPLHPERTIVGEVFLTVWLRDAGGNRFVAKLMADGFPVGELEWQQLMLDRLESRALDFATPQLVRTTGGDTRVELDVGDRRYEMFLLTWVDGELVSDLSSVSRSLLFDIGRVSATLTEAIGDLEHPYAARRHRWRVVETEELVRASLPARLSTHERACVDTVSEFFQSHFPAFDLLPQATVHQDLNRHNVTVFPARPDRVHGVIDFNDAVRTVRIADLSVALTCALIDPTSEVADAKAVLRGYESITQLDGAEREALLPLAAGRLLASWLFWTQLAEVEASTYAKLRSRDSFPAIERLVAYGLERARQELLE